MIYLGLTPDGKWYPLEHEGDYNDDIRLFKVYMNLKSEPMIEEISNEG